MNFPDIENAVKHLQKTCKCPQCNTRYKLENVNVMASTKTEALFELNCHKCECSSIVTVLQSMETEMRETISENDILDIKNFLSNFDGNFKKIFSKKLHDA